MLRLVAKGMSYKQIAERLFLSHRTVQNHVQNTLRKLQLHNRVQLVRYAIEQGLDEIDDDLTRVTRPRTRLREEPVVRVALSMHDAGRRSTTWVRERCCSAHRSVTCCGPSGCARG